ncbi:uncharacterized protein N7525_010382 [Penicillium rubens]|uniref:uncharacterized protein n=1 Tax=Penicillium rubens TaxID=1108849 RepID=UPI002A59EEC8|nr:uncharacterized protein N7525_010382 [Penicillium rubens]KAJ5821098.1 hypothetical protein N7525_010382 [Penicillium rubens]
MPSAIPSTLPSTQVGHFHADCYVEICSVEERKPRDEKKKAEEDEKTAREEEKRRKDEEKEEKTCVCDIHNRPKKKMSTYQSASIQSRMKFTSFFAKPPVPSVPLSSRQVTAESYEAPGV